MKVAKERVDSINQHFVLSFFIDVFIDILIYE